MTSGGRLTRLAEAEAGLPDPESAARILAAEPEAARVLDALDATRADLRAVPPGRLPLPVAARLAAALDAVDDTEHGRRAPRRGIVARPARRPRVLLLSGVTGVLVAAVLTGPPAPAPADVTGVARQVLAEGTLDVGPLADPAALAGCLARAGAPASSGYLLAGRPVRIGEHPGTLLVFSTGKLGRIRAVVPAADCTGVLADVTTGG